MRDKEIVIGLHVWSHQSDFSGVMFIFSLPVNMTLKNNSKYIKCFFSIGFFERYVNSKSDYLELLLSVHYLAFPVHVSSSDTRTYSLLYMPPVEDCHYKAIFAPVSGFGFSLCYIASYSMVPLYFKDNQKMMALGILSLGSAIGAMVIPILLEKLIETYGWRGTLLIVGGIASNICVSASLGYHRGDTINALEKYIYNDEISIIQSQQKQETQNNASLENSLSHEDKSKVARPFRDRVKTLFTNRPFVLYGISIMMTFPPIIAILIFLIDYYQAKDIPRTTGVWVYFGMNVSGFVCRILVAFLVKVERIPKLAIPVSLNIVGSFAMFAFPFTNTVSECVVASCLFGASLAGMVSLMSITSLELVGKDDYPLALGIIFTLLGVANAIAGPLSGKATAEIN